MSTTTEEKKTILHNLLAAFSSLTAYSQDKLYKIIGPIVTGIEIFKMPRKHGVKKCLNAPLILQEIKQKRTSANHIL